MGTACAVLSTRHLYACLGKPLELGLGHVDYSLQRERESLILEGVEPLWDQKKEKRTVVGVVCCDVCELFGKLGSLLKGSDG